MAVESTRWAVLYCPKRGLLDNSKKRWQRIEKALVKNNIAFDKVQSESQGSVERLVKMLINNGYKTILIIGGDSALNDAANCLMQVDKQVRDEITLGIIPNGIMNDFAHFWGIEDGDIEKNVCLLREHRTKKIDLGCIRYKNKHGENCHRYFLNCVNVGFIAAIMNLRRKTRHVFGSRTLSFLFSFLLLIFQRLDYAMKIKINSDSIQRRLMTVCVGNALGYGQTPNAVPYNGLLDASLVYHTEISQLFEGLYLFIRGKFLNHRSVHPYRTKEIVFELIDHAMIGIDGRLMAVAPNKPFKITVEQEVLNFLIPS